MPNDLVSIIVPTYNREEALMACLVSLSQVSYLNREIIVVDDGSEDNTVASVATNFPDIEVVMLGRNSGPAVARNEGVKRARGNYLCFVDSDNRVHPDFLTELVRLAESDTQIGFVGPKMYYLSDPNTIWYAGAAVSLVTSKTCYLGLGEHDRGQYDGVRDVGHIPNVWLVRRKVIEQIGPMDERYVMHYEESDWAMRARRTGYRVVLCPSSYVYHDLPLVSQKRRNLRAQLGLDTPTRAYYAARNRSLFMKKFAHSFNFVLFLLVFNNAFLFNYCLVYLLHNRFDLVKSYLRGYIAGLRG